MKSSRAPVPGSDTHAPLAFHGDTAGFAADTLTSFAGTQSSGDVFITSMAGIHGADLIPALLKKLGNIFLYFAAFSDTRTLAELGLLKLRLLERLASEGRIDYEDPVIQDSLPVLFDIAGALCRDTETTWVILIEDFESLSAPETAMLSAAQLRILDGGYPIHLVPYAAPRS
jgi:hypothetical protein